MNSRVFLEGKVAIVTGSSRGIGAAIAKALAMEKAAVVVNYYKSGKEAKQIVEEIEASGGKGKAIKADIANREEVNRMVEITLEEFGGIDILVNNAHRPFSPRPFSDVSWTEFQEQINATVQGAFNCCQAVLRNMTQKRSGRIINIGSVTVDSPELSFDFGFIVRNTAKAALSGFSKTLALEVAPLGITVNMIAPGWVLTDQSCTYPEAVRQMAAERTPMGRLATPEEIAKAVLFYASDWSDFVTGSYLPVCGGAVMQ